MGISGTSVRNATVTRIPSTNALIMALGSTGSACPHTAEIEKRNIHYTCGHVADVCNKCYSKEKCVTGDGGRKRVAEDKNHALPTIV